MQKSSYPDKWYVAIATSLVIFVANANLTAVNLAIPAIAHDLNVGMYMISWVISSYIITSGMFMILGGRMGDVFGIKRMFLLSLILWIISLTLAATAHNFTFLIIARVLQGLAFAISLPLCMVVITKVFPENQMSLAVSINITVLGLAQILGPSLSGVILEYLTWRWIFLLNIPLCVIAFLFSIYSIKKDQITQKQQLDYLGAIILAISLCVLMLILSLIQQNKLTTQYILLYFIVDISLFILFYIIEKRTQNPIVDFKLLFSRAFFLINLIRMLYQYVYFVFLFIFPLYLMKVLQMSAVKTGGLLLFLTVPFAVFSPIVGKYALKLGELRLMIVSFVASIMVFFWYAHLHNISTSVNLLIPLIPLGISTAILFSYTTSIALNSAPLEKRGSASGIFFSNTLIAGAVGISITSILIQLFTQIYTNRTSNGTPKDIEHPFSLVFSNIMWMCLVLSALGLLLLFILKFKRADEPLNHYRKIKDV
ncbi:MAG TPA: MFS transporter [Patescibacteria group bacterium]|nr:MFS transporter [Gammaproteobacteria bacterium]HWA52496.1 MFS transporter [Patescibacteria group bacterium]